MVGVVRRLLPWRAVVLPWIVSRALVTVALLLSPTPDGRLGYQGHLLAMDGQWYAIIARNGYPHGFRAGAWSVWPFFPLYPLAAGTLVHLGAPLTPSMASVSWLGALVAFAGLHRLATTRLDPQAVRWVVWIGALVPGALTLVLGYADSWYLAGLVWALVFADERRWWLAGMAAAVATIARPNGVIAALGVGLVAFATVRSWRAIVAAISPSLLALAAWMWFLDTRTGDALVFWRAKSAWDELTLVEFVRHPAARTSVLFEAIVLLAVLAVSARQLRRMPWPWLVVVALTLLPPLVLGMEGLARYATLAAPMTLASAAEAGRWRPSRVIAALVAASALLVLLAVLVVERSWVP